jgi:hypothetical protein
MILEESAIIMAPPERIARFFETLDEHYLDWHPDHVSFSWLDGARHEYFHFDERIGGWKLHMPMRVTRSADGHRAVCRPTSPLVRLVFPWMSFDTRPEDGGSRYTHRIKLRLGPLRPLIERTFLRPLRRHMHDEAQNLAQLVAPSTVA